MAINNIPYSGPIVTRAEAKAAGLKRYFPGKPCIRGHITQRWVDGGCIHCNIERKKVWRELNPDTHRERAYKWRYSNWGRHLETQREWMRKDRDRNPQKYKNYRLASIDKHRAHYLKWRTENREYNLARMRKWRTENKDWHKKWRKENRGTLLISKHKRRAKEANAGGSFTEADLTRIRSQQKDRCAYCRKPLKDSQHLDHIKPIALGGSSWPSNIQFLCKSCNLSKGMKDPIEFMREHGRLL